MEQVRESSPQSTSRVAGVLFLICILTAGSGEMFFHGKMLIALGLVAVACCVAMTLLLYGIFKPVQKSLAALGMSLNLVGLLLEAVQFNPKGVDIALVFHGIYCLVMGYLAFHSTFLPRTLGILMAMGGLGWFTFVSPSLATRLSPVNLVYALLCEGAFMLWLLVARPNLEQRKEKISRETIRL
jgi:uncharacterized membrane protein YbjE (DUF340 family)